MSRVTFILFGLLIWIAALGGCMNSSAPPAPVAEIPALLSLPNDLSIGVQEIQGSGAEAGMTFGSRIKAQAFTSEDIRRAIEGGAGSVEESNGFLDLALGLISHREIPVDSSLFTFDYEQLIDGKSFQFSFDFRPFDLDGDGEAELCSGCTCPTGCSPAITECPRQAPVEDLRQICFRIWINGKRFMAGVFDRVPSPENPESGSFRFQFLDEFDLAGSLYAIDYDHRDPENLRTDIVFFQKDPDVDPENFFSRGSSFALQEGPAPQAKKTSRLHSQFLDEQESTLKFQGQFFSHLDLIQFESFSSGIFETGLGIPTITPPLCAEISSGEPVAKVLCDDLGLTLITGNFPSLPEIPQVALPNVEEFPETPP